MIRILHLITSFGLGGAEGNLARVVSHMDSTRFLNDVVVMQCLPRFHTEFAAETVPFQCLGMRPGVPNLPAIYRLTAIVRAARPHVLQTWMYHADLLGLLVGRLTRTPAIAWNLRRSFVGMSEHGWLSRMVLRAAVRFSPEPDAVVTNSLAGQRTHKALGYRPRRWVWIPIRSTPIDSGLTTARQRHCAPNSVWRRIRGWLDWSRALFRSKATAISLLSSASWQSKTRMCTSYWWDGNRAKQRATHSDPPVERCL